MATTEAADGKVLSYMEDTARYRDRLYFASDQTCAAALGVSRHTVLRARQRLERCGRIRRVGVRRLGRLKATVCYRIEGRATQRTTCQPKTLRKHPQRFLLRYRCSAFCTRMNSERGRKRPPDETWDVLTELFGEPRTPSERGRRNRAVRELKEAAATSDEIRATYAYCKQFPSFTEMAICLHLSAATAQAAQTDNVRDLFRRHAQGGPR